MNNKKTIAFIVTAEYAAKAFLTDHLKKLSNEFNTLLFVNTNNPSFLDAKGIPTKIIPISIQRKVSLIKDIYTFIELYILLLKYRPDAIHSVTPKAGLLGMASGMIAGVPVRIHTFTGQVWVTKHGIKRWLLKKIDWLIACLSTQNTVDGYSQRGFLISENILSEDNSFVFANGSITGVNLNKFKPDLVARDFLRKKLNIPPDATVFLFIGRLNKDKGVLDLAIAFKNLSLDKAHLVFIGPDEEAVSPIIMKLYAGLKNIHFIEYTEAPEKYMAMSDVICLPSYREGFNNVVIEAGAVGVPAIASNIYGIRDAVINYQTGLLHEPGNINEIAKLIKIISENSELRNLLGNNAKKYVSENFNSILVTDAWLSFYRKKFSD